MQKTFKEYIDEECMDKPLTMVKWAKLSAERILEKYSDEEELNRVLKQKPELIEKLYLAFHYISDAELYSL